MNFDAEIEKYMQEKYSKSGKGEDVEIHTHDQFITKMEELKNKTSSKTLKESIQYKIDHHDMNTMDAAYKEMKKHVDNRDGGIGPLGVIGLAILALVIIGIIMTVVFLVKHLKNKKSSTTEKFNTVRSDRTQNESFGAFVERGPSVTYPDPYIKYNYYDEVYDKNQSQFDDKFCSADDDSEDSMQDNYSVGRIVQPQFL